MTSKQVKKLTKVYTTLKAFMDGGYELERVIGMARHDYALSARELDILKQALQTGGFFGGTP